MGVIIVGGLGEVEIAGDTPTPEETEQILKDYREYNSHIRDSELSEQAPPPVAEPPPQQEETEPTPRGYITDRFGLPTTVPVSETEFDMKRELIPQIVGGLRDATQNTLDLIFDDLPELAEGKWGRTGGISWMDKEGGLAVPRYLPPDEWRQQQENLRAQGISADIGDVELPEAAPAKTVGGNIVRTVSQFFVPYLGAMKLMGKGKTALGTAMKMEAGAVLTGQAVFDPFDEKLADLIQAYPQLENPVTEYLQTDPDDSVAEARFKLALEDIGLGAISATVLQSLRALGHLKRGNVKESLSDADEALAAMPRTDEAPLPDEVLSSGGKLDPAGTASKVDEVDQAAVEHASRRLMANQAAENIEDVPVTLSPGSQVVKTTGPKYAGNINLDRIEAPDDIKQVIIETAENFEGLLDTARRGTIKDEQLIQLASDLNMTVEDLLSRRPGELWNAEKILAARQIMLASATKVRNASIQASRTGLDTDLMALKDAMNVHVGIEAEVSGLAAEAGRALRQFRYMPGMVMEEVLSGAGGRKSLKEIADRIAVMSPDDLSNFNKIIKVANDPTMTDKFLEYWINSLLSGYKTHAVNAISNTLTQLASIPEKYMAAAWGTARGAGKMERITFGEANTHALSLIEGIRDGFRLAKQTLITGEPSDLFSKLESRRQSSIKGLKGELIRIPGRLLMTSDEFFKGIGYRMELNSLAYRDAIRAGLDPVKDPRKFAEYYQKVINNPPKKLDLQAMDVARDRTFTKPLEETGRSIQSILANRPILRLFAPFVRTPTNIVKYAAKRTPFGYFAKSVRESKGIARDEAMGKLALGSAAMAGGGYAASQGQITGSGPTDPQARARKRETGWQPYSFAIEQEDGRTRYLAYNRVEPLGIIFGLAADFAEISGELGEEDRDSIASMMVASVSQNLLDKTFFKGVSDVIEAINQPDRMLETYFNNQLGTLVPTLFSQTAQNVDPVLRDTRTALDRVKSRIPGYSQDLPARRNLWGEPILLEGGLGPDWLSPIYSSFSKEDPVSDELERLNVEERQEYYPSKPQRTLNGKEIPPHLYAEFSTRAGRLAHRELSLAIQTPAYQSLGERGLPSQQTKLFRETINKYRNYARFVLELQMGGEHHLNNDERAILRDLQRNHPDIYDNIQLPDAIPPEQIRSLINDGINIGNPITGERLR